MAIFGNILVLLIYFYLFILFFRLLIPFIKIPNNAVFQFILIITDPVIDFFKKYFPLKIKKIDFSPVFPILILLFIIMIIKDFMILQVPINLFYFIGLLIRIIDFIFISIMILLILCNILLLIIDTNHIYTKNPFIDLMKYIFNKMINISSKIFKINSSSSYRIHLMIILITLILFSILGHLILMIILQPISFYQGNIYKPKIDNILE